MALCNFIRQGSTNAAVTVNFSVGGTATFNTDYTVTFPPGITGTWAATSGSVTIPIGSSQVDVTVSPVGDVTLENDETIIVTITSVSPATPISSANGAALLVIKNDDFLVLVKWVGVTITGTILAGTLFNTDGNGNQVIPWLATNTGTAPANWSNWVIGLSDISGSATGAYSETIRLSGLHARVSSNPVGAFSTPYLIKIVFRLPSTAHSNTTDRFILFSSPSNTFTVLYVMNSSGTWNLEIGGTGIVKQVFSGLALGSWHDLIIDITTVSITSNLDGVNTLTGNSPVPSISTFYLRAGFQGAMAAFAVNRSQTYSPSLFPITPANL